MTMARKLAPAFFGLSLVGWATSCSLALNFDEVQCEKAEDCQKRGFSGAVCESNVCVTESGSTGANMTSTSTGNVVVPGFECMGNMKYPDPMGMPVSQVFHFEDALAGVGTIFPQGEIAANLCSPLSGQCGTPIQANIPTDAMGQIEVNVPSLPAYLDVFDVMPSGAGGAGLSQDDYRPGIVYETRPIVLPPAPKVIRVIKYKDFVTLASLVQATEEPTHGIALVLTVNCNDQRAAGVQISVDPADMDDKTVTAYFKGSIPKLGPTETDSEGAFAMVNIPVMPNGDPKPVTFHAKLAATGEQIGTATVFIRKGTVTYVHVGPTPNGE